MSSTAVLGPLMNPIGAAIRSKRDGCCKLHLHFQHKTFQMLSFKLALCAIFIGSTLAQKVVLTNDDGWAVAQIRAQNDALKAAGFDVSMIFPACRS